jgi:hypothetical protein
MFVRVTLLRAMFSYGALDVAGKEKPADERIDRVINVAKYEYAHEQSRHGEAVAPEPVQVALRGLFAHKQQYHRAAVERRDWEQIERSQQ